MKKVDISCYLKPRPEQADEADEQSVGGDRARPMKDITYSVVLGYGFRRNPKPPLHEPRTNEVR
jgi:hypothetical protein